MREAENEVRRVQEMVEEAKCLESTSLHTLRDQVCREAWARMNCNHVAFTRLLDEVRGLSFSEVCTLMGFVQALHDERKDGDKR